MDPITGAALIGGGAQIFGGLLGSSAAGKAARAQSKAAADQLAFSREQFDYYRGKGEPMYAARDIAMSQLMSELGLPPIQARMPGDVQAQAQYEAAQAPAAQPVAQPTGPNNGWTQMASGLWQNPVTGEMRTSQAPPEWHKGDPTTGVLAGAAPTPTAPTEAQTPYEAQYFTPTPQNQLTDYDKFLMEEAQRSARTAAGGQLGARALRDLQNQSAYIVQQSRENRLNRLASLAQVAQTSGGAASALAQGSAGQITGAMGNMGAARSSGYINRANQLTGTMQNLGAIGGWWADRSGAIPQGGGAIPQGNVNKGYFPGVPSYAQPWMR